MYSKRKTKSEKLKVLGAMFTVLISLFIFTLFSLRSANAQVSSPAPIPPHNPTPIPCSSTGDPEFHSLRPYQASPCVAKMAETAKFCGNTLTLQDQIDVPYKPGIDNCSQPSGGKVVCNYVIPRSEKITINLSNAKLPIMGNTENVPNSQTPTDDSPTLNDKEKVNGYVSWYLNGVMNRAEDGSSENNSYNIVNLSGPLNKLLPGVISDAQRIKSINNAKVINHNQIVVCTDHDPGFWGSILDVFKLGKYTAKPCYANNGSPASDETRLTEWNGMLSVGNLMLNESIKFAVQGLRLIYPFAPTGLIEESIGRHWNSRLPPLPWENDPYANPTRQMTSTEYQKYYNEWQGKTCVIIPIIDYLVCFNNILIPSKYADMYSYVPLSSTEDVTGNIEIDSYSVGGPGITYVTFTSQSSTLFFPHLTESDQLGSTLQDTYISKDQQKDQKTGAATAVAPPSSCTTVDVRSNAGDKLFATSLSGTLGYTASFSCTFNAPVATTNCYSACLSYGGFPGECRAECTSNPDAIPIPTPLPPQTCSKTVSIALSTSSNTPKIDDIWSRLVAGPTAVVKRMFPKLGTQIGTLKDIPGSTSIDYSGSAQGSGELNLPHVGGISEYFLKGIQTMLRPKGYGEPISFGPITSTTTTSGDICGVASKYNIPCCQLKGIISVETGATEDTPKTPFVGSGSCNGQPSCCNGNYCGPANISCSQYAGLTNSDNLDMCSYNDSAVLLSRAMLLARCQADHVCNSYDWSKWGDYVLQHYTIPDGDYTASAYFYGLANGCRATSCSQYRWGANKSYCDSVESYCDTGKALESFAHPEFCKQCNDEEMAPAGFPLTCP